MAVERAVSRRKRQTHRRPCMKSPVITSARQARVFKTCPKCGRQWPSAEDFLTDAAVRLLGFQPGPEGHQRGFFLFHHHQCDSSLTVSMSAFEPLGLLVGFASSRCAAGLVTKLCLAAMENRPCPPQCVCESVWKIMGLIDSWPKDQPAQTSSTATAHNP